MEGGRQREGEDIHQSSKQGLLWLTIHGLRGSIQPGGPSEVLADFGGGGGGRGRGLPFPHFLSISFYFILTFLTLLIWYLLYAVYFCIFQRLSFRVFLLLYTENSGRFAYIHQASVGCIWAQTIKMKLKIYKSNIRWHKIPRYLPFKLTPNPDNVNLVCFLLSKVMYPNGINLYHPPFWSL